MSHFMKAVFLLLCASISGQCGKMKHNLRRTSEQHHKHGTPLFKKMLDQTKTHQVRSDHLLRVDDHDFTMRPAFAGPAVPVGVDVQVESLDSISEVDMPFNSTDDKISLSQFLIQKFHTTSRLAFYSSTGWYNRLYINFSLRRHIFFFLLQTYFPATLMVMLSWVSFWIDCRAVPARVSLGWYNRLYINFSLRRHIFFFLLQTYFPATLMVMLSWVSFWIDCRAVPARVSLGITTVLTMSTIITGVNASMPRVSYIKAVDIYLWVSFVFVFLSVIEYAAINYLTTVHDGTDRKSKEKPLPWTCDISHARTMILDEAYSKPDANSLAGYTQAPVSTEEAADKQDHMVVCLSLANEATGAKRKTLRGLRIIQNTHVIDAYSRIIFPGAFIFFNLIYWSVYC
ncbi:gamma-aminobutyric acid receptor subunit rho-2-like [Sinocyclocheilus grahami]|uniref:gamma-aminobutyric acid receptor subunit rho-2-like n=1 Tax=Sinocyclocheilus grahami TaxID=75366 RepID=UPI0007AC6721|nr:PREDICTED: gamma-aminobutyric acid receptor subunit rho-2-like [Sinocyclocheilus grahami]